ncbi:MAG: putative Ribonuclease [Candidatus Saccharibacteria bacterium]|nr:putative Ribonuclease [Candidatus Saccharibacteria bacterium]
MNSTQIGRKAEQAARTYLEMRGFQILEQNFRRPNTEIDIVARKDNTVHLVEVKYRASDDQGGGYDAITASKLKKMRYGAEVWVTETKWAGEYVLSAVEVSEPNFQITGFIENAY